MLKAIGELLAENIRERRKALKVTQADFASSIDMPFRTYQAIESGESWPQRLNLEAIARGLDVHPSELFIDPEAITPEQALGALKKLIERQK